MQKLFFLFVTFMIVIIILGRGTSGESYRVPLEVLRDPAGRMTLDDVLDPGTSLDFLAVSGQGFTGGFTRDTFWFRFEIKPFETGATQVFLEVQPPYLDNIQLFVPDANGGYQSSLAGDIYPFSERIIAYRAPVLIFPNPPAPITAYIRLQSHSTSAMFVTAWTPSEFYEASLLEYILFGGYIGLLLVFIGFNLSRRQWLGLTGLQFHMLFIASILLATLSSSGLIGQYVWPEQPWFNQIMTPVTTLGLLIAAYMHYARLMNDGDGGTARARLIEDIIYGIFAVCFVSIFLGSYVVTAPFFIIVSAAAGIWLTTRYLTASVKKGMAFWTLASLLCGLVGFLLTALSILGILPGYVLLMNAFYLTSLATMVNYQILINVRIKRLASTQQHALLEAAKLQERLLNEQTFSDTQSRFLAMIHHELRTPLSVIRLTLGMKNASLKVKTYANEAVRNIETILERSALSQKLDHNTLTPRYQEIDIVNLIEQLFIQSPENSRLCLEISPETGKHTVKTDPDLLMIVLTNVIENSVKYAVEESSIDIAIKFQSESFKCCITVSNKLDNAHEIDTTNIFNRYVRAPSAAKFSGSGLGLYIAKGLVNSLHGDISCALSQEKIEFKICL